MTTKPKTRKAPAAKAVAPKAIPNERPLANKLTDAMDMLNFAKSYIECIYMAAASLMHHQREPIAAVADMASTKIGEAIALLEDLEEPVSPGDEASP